LNLTLLVKAYHGSQLKQIDELLQSQLGDLDVEVKLLGNPINKWVQVSVAGEDEAVAAAYIRKEIGVCPASLKEVEEGTVLKGYISRVDEGKLTVDVGVFEPKVVQAVVSLASLQSQLAGGRDVPIKRIAELYPLAEGFPVSVTVVSKSSEALQAELSAEQVEKFLSWQRSLLDRLIVLRASKELIAATLERTRLDRDVIEVEPLGLFEFALTCKLGTDAAGLIPRVGRYMRYAVFVVFNAKRSGAFLGGKGLSL
jgi:hypothetical protein